MLTVSRRLRVRVAGDGARAVLTGLVQHGLRDGVHAVRGGPGGVVRGRDGGLRDVRGEHVRDRRRGGVHGVPERPRVAYGLVLLGILYNLARVLLQRGLLQQRRRRDGVIVRSVRCGLVLGGGRGGVLNVRGKYLLKRRRGVVHSVPERPRLARGLVVRRGLRDPARVLVRRGLLQ